MEALAKYAEKILSMYLLLCKPIKAATAFRYRQNTDVTQYLKNIGDTSHFRLADLCGLHIQYCLSRTKPKRIAVILSLQSFIVRLNRAETEIECRVVCYKFSPADSITQAGDLENDTSAPIHRDGFPTFETTNKQVKSILNIAMNSQNKCSSFTWYNLMM